jgi:polyketide cyclase/dehydrase/lipid transport protein
VAVSHRQQLLIDAPLKDLWAVLGETSWLPEWCPGLIEGQDCQPEPGSRDEQVTKASSSQVENAWVVERLEDCREMRVRCPEEGCYARWLLTAAQGGTFVDFEVGMESQPPEGGPAPTVGHGYYRDWLDRVVASLRQALAERTARGDSTPLVTAID